MYVKILPSTIKDKKYTAIFYDDNKKVKTVHFGNSNYEDFTTHKDIERKAKYIQRHRNNENWNDYMTAGSLSRYVLWEYTSINRAKREYAKRFNLKLI